MIALDRDPRRILLVRLSHLGDCARALPLFEALRAGFPDAELAWAIEPAFASLVERLPGLAACPRFERRGGWRAWPRLRRALRAFAPELAVDAQGNAKSAAVVRCSGAPLRAGWHPGDWRERPFARLALNRFAAPAGPQRVHAGARVEHLIRELGLEPPAPRAVARLFAAHVPAGHAALEGLRPRAEAAPLLLQLGASGDPRSSPPAQTLAVARALLQRGTPPILLAGPLELAQARQLQRELGPELALIGPQPLDALAGLLIAAAERGGRLLGSDSGPAHLAAAVGTPCVTLHGPFDPARTGLWPRPGTGSPHRELLSEAPPDCRPCARRRCTHPDGNVCITGIRVEQMLEALPGR